MEARKLNSDLHGTVSLLRALSKKFFLKQEYHPLIFKSKGLEFEGYSRYNPSGDDASLIDWKATQRTGELMIRKFKQERELKVAFFVDAGDNMVFGSGEKLKCEYAAEVSAGMANLIIESNNLISYYLFADEIKAFRKFSPGRTQLNLFYDSLLDAGNYGGGSNLNLAVDYALNYFSKDVSIVFFVSDFLNIDNNLLKKFQALSSHFDVVAFKVTDVLDMELPDIDESLVLEEPGTHRQVLVNPKIAKRVYDSYAHQKNDVINKALKNSGVTVVEFNTSESFIAPIAMFLKDRLRRGGL